MQPIKNHHRSTSTAKILSTSTKHWTAYIGPILIIMLGVLFIFPFGIILTLLGIYLLLNVKSVKWILTEHELIIQSGFLPWHKSYFEIPIDDLFEAFYIHGFWATLLGFGRIEVRRKEGITTAFYAEKMNNHKDITQQTNILIKNLKKLRITPNDHSINTSSSVSDELIKLSGLLEKGLLTADEYNEQKVKLLRVG